MLVVIESMKVVIPDAIAPDVSPRDSRQRATLEVSLVFATRSSAEGFIPNPPEPSWLLENHASPAVLFSALRVPRSCMVAKAEAVPVTISSSGPFVFLKEPSPFAVRDNIQLVSFAGSGCANPMNARDFRYSEAKFVRGEILIGFEPIAPQRSGSPVFEPSMTRDLNQSSRSYVDISPN